MHLLWYGDNVLDLHGFSTLLSVVVLVGALYGFLRLLHDLGGLGLRAFGWQRDQAP